MYNFLKVVSITIQLWQQRLNYIFDPSENFNPEKSNEFKLFLWGVFNRIGKVSLAIFSFYESF